MAVITERTALQSRLQTLIGDRTDDDALNFIQDALDTFDHHSSNSGITQAEHDRLMKEQDDSWRQRYKDAFFNGADSSLTEPNKETSREDPANSVPGSSENNPAHYDDLFKED